MTHRPLLSISSPITPPQNPSSIELRKPTKANLYFALLIASFVFTARSLFFAYHHHYSTGRLATNQDSSSRLSQHHQHFGNSHSIHSNTITHIKSRSQNILGRKRSPGESTSALLYVSTHYYNTIGRAAIR